MELTLKEELYLTPVFFIAATMFLDVKLITLEHGLLLTSFAASTFILFMNEGDERKNFLFSHVVGVVCGLISSQVSASPLMSQGFTAALAVAATSLIMKHYHLDHPPANGTCLGVLLNPVSSRLIFSVSSTLLVFYLMYQLFLYTKKRETRVS